MSNHPANTSNQKSNNAFFDIHSLQWLIENKEPDYDRTHCNNHYEIIWVTGDSLSHWIDLQRTDSVGNRFFLIRPGQMHRFDLSHETKGYRISFSEAFLDMEDHSSNAAYYNSLFRLFSCPEGITINDDLADDLEEIIQRLIKEFGHAHLFRTEILKRYFKIFLIYLARLFEERFSETRQTRNAELLQKFMCLLEERYKINKMVSDYAAELSITPNYLNEIIKKMTGFSAGYHIRSRIALEAKRMCRYSDNCMKEIAYKLGFSDSAQFSKFFKSITGMNFSEFKKEKITLLPAA